MCGIGWLPLDGEAARSPPRARVAAVEEACLDVPWLVLGAEDDARACRHLSTLRAAGTQQGDAA
eukprot:6203156-Pleurochrysis_carterae.AAC.2